MIMKKLILFVVAVLFSTISAAQTDYQCVNDCTQKGYQYQFCTSQCSFNNNSNNVQQYTQPQQRIKQTDYQCVNDCTQKGYQYQFCTERCSY